MNPFYKSPNEILDHVIRLVGNDTFISASWTSTPTGLTVTTGLVVGTNAIVRVAGGSAGVEYEVTGHMIGASGQEYEHSFLVQVEQRLITKSFDLGRTEILDFQSILWLGDPEEGVIDPIMGASWTISPAGPVVVMNTFSDTTATGRISGNNAALGIYTATILLTGLSGQKYEQAIRINVLKR